MLPSGALVLGLGDTVVLNDPLTAQGANQAARGAMIYLERILDRAEGAFDGVWMQETFNQWWQAAQWATCWTNAMLQPATPHLAKLLRAAAILPGIAQGFADGFDDPGGLFPWLIDPFGASEYLMAHFLSLAHVSHPGGVILA
jgi:hypothetical protein